jgi:laccase
MCVCVCARALHHAGIYYFGIGEWSSSPLPNYTPPPPALGMLQYTSGSSSSTVLAPKFPTLPMVNASTDLANAFRDRLFGLANYSLPQKVDREFVFAASVANVVCKAEENCTTKIGATINNATFDNPVNSSILESYYYGIKGVYKTDFPTLPPAIVNFTSSETVAAYNLTGNRGTKVVTLKYNETVQLVLQDLNGLLLEDHPFHLHGHNFYVVGRGTGNFNGSHDPESFNLVDPPMRNTIVLPKGGWVAIRFMANNPGEFYHSYNVMICMWFHPRSITNMDCAIPVLCTRS